MGLLGATFEPAQPVRNPLYGATQGEDGLWRDANGNVINNGGKTISAQQTQDPYANPTWGQRVLTPAIAAMQVQGNNQFYQQPLMANQEADTQREVAKRMTGLTDDQYGKLYSSNFSPQNQLTQGIAQGTIDKGGIPSGIKFAKAVQDASASAAENETRENIQRGLLAVPESNAQVQAANNDSNLYSYANILAPTLQSTAANRAISLSCTDVAWSSLAFFASFSAFNLSACVIASETCCPVEASSKRPEESVL